MHVAFKHTVKTRSLISEAHTIIHPVLLIYYYTIDINTALVSYNTTIVIAESQFSILTTSRKNIGNEKNGVGMAK